MRVAIYDDIGRITSEQLLGLRDAEFVAMADVDMDSVDLHVDRGAQPGVAGFVGIAVDGVHGGDDGELLEDFVAADIAGVEDQLYPGQSRVNFGSKETMRVRDQPDPTDGRWEMGDLR